MFLSDITSQLARQYRDARAFRRTLDELGTLGDRELADLGISRHDIREVAKGAIKRG